MLGLVARASRPPISGDLNMLIQVEIHKQLTQGPRVFSLEVSFAAQSARVVLFGPSGSGKTVTVKAIAGLLRPDAGRIIIGGRVLFDGLKNIDISARRRNIGYVPQDYALFHHLSVTDNIAFGLRKPWFGRLTPRDRLRLAEFLEIFELQQLKDSLPKDISGGQRQRTALARALIPEPSLLLLDEPFAALDTLLRARMRQHLLKVQTRFQIPVILITHDPEDVAVLAQNVVVYENGKIRERVPATIFGRPTGPALIS
jgi:molybdate transport system ATP-binding protein